MSEQVGWRGLVRNIRDEAPLWTSMLPKLPRMLYRALHEDRAVRVERLLEALLATERRRTRVLEWIVLLLAAALAWSVFFAVF